MCIAKSPTPPPMPALPKREEVPKAPTRLDPEVQQARKDERKRLAARKGAQGTILTSSAGLLVPAQTTGKSVLGG